MDFLTKRKQLASLRGTGEEEGRNGANSTDEKRGKLAIGENTCPAVASESRAGDQKASKGYKQRLLEMINQHRGAVALVLGATVLINILGLAAPRITQAILDVVVPGKDLILLAEYLLVLIYVRVSLSLDRTMLSAMCRHVLSLPIRFFKHRRARCVLSPIYLP
jgi:ABC-type bacteriocin/lantibiotic exporter with double-glycine peptidase domain